MAAKKKVARPSNNIPKGSGIFKSLTPKDRAKAKAAQSKARRALEVWGTSKDAGSYGGGAAKASVAKIKKSKVTVTTKQKKAVASGKTTRSRMGTEGRYSRGEAQPRHPSPDYGAE